MASNGVKFRGFFHHGLLKYKQWGRLQHTTIFNAKILTIKKRRRDSRKLCYQQLVMLMILYIDRDHHDPKLKVIPYGILRKRANNLKFNLIVKWKNLRFISKKNSKILVALGFREILNCKSAIFNCKPSHFLETFKNNEFINLNSWLSETII